MFFGKKLKELRIKHAKMGIRKFKEKMGTEFSVKELMDIEHGYSPCPYCSWFSNQIRMALGLSVDHEDWEELCKLAIQPFVMQKMPELLTISPFTKKSDGSTFTEEEFVDLSEYINSIAREHNKKAEEHNKQNGL